MILFGFSAMLTRFSHISFGAELVPKLIGGDLWFPHGRRAVSLMSNLTVLGLRLDLSIRIGASS